MKNLSEILVATTNKGKIREFEDLLCGFGLRFRGLSEFPHITEVAENGQTFAENAALKACGYARQTGLPTLADDSGLEVAALNNAPGIFSARFGGIGLSDAQRVEKLLADLENIGLEERQARFVCVIALANENGEIYYSATGICNGRIAANPLGTNGFGYDPIFVPDGYENTFGELQPSIKHKISHRAHAVNEIIRFLQDFLQN
ncbi:MAG: RdgB/HAM1 family non-canonical purine NTP pyrophosphatase [Pyrinomonadaceae bacterium]